MTRDFLRVAFRYPFVQLGCNRVTGYVPASNADALRFDLNLGFKIEGRMREAIETGEDVLVLGMLRGECRFIQMRKHG
jgi:RimJ/RimL family protein N-acetyltransferase